MAIESSKNWNSVADNTLLTSAPGETGGAFARASFSEDAVPPRIFSGAVTTQDNNGNGQYYYDTTALGSADFTIKATAYTGDHSSAFFDIFFRSGSADGTGSGGYGFFWNRSTNQLELRRFNPSYVSLATASGSGLHDNNIDIYVQTSGSQITCWIRRVSDGFYWNPATPGFQSGSVNIFNYTDGSPVTQVGKQGFGNRLSTSSPTTWTAWEIDVAGGGGGATPIDPLYHCILSQAAGRASTY